MAIPLVLGAGAGAIARQQALKGVGKLTTNPMYKGAGSSVLDWAPAAGIPVIGATALSLPLLQRQQAQEQQAQAQQAAAMQQYYNTPAGQAAMAASHARTNELLPNRGYAQGGLVGGTESLDLPNALAQLLPTQGVNSAAYAAAGVGVSGTDPMSPTLDFRSQPTYAEGGQVGPDGNPVGAPPTGPAGLAPQGGQGAPMDSQMVEMHLQKFMRENPEQVNQIKQVVLEAMQTGELTQEDLNMAVQLATVALQNPDMYPQVRQFAIQRGLVDESELSTEYDQGLIFVLLLAAKAAQAETAGAAPGGNFSAGGMINKGTGPTSDDVSIRVSKGEYVIPADVVKAKGTDFFDKMINPKGGAGTA